MIIDCISDLHGYLPELTGGDLLIIAGDLTAMDTDKEHFDFMENIGYHQMFKDKYEKVIYIAGNHDGFLDPKTKRHGRLRTPRHWNVYYLCDSGIKHNGLNIWGSPWTPTFHSWFFMKNRGDQIKEMWDKIPDDTNILITHGPPFGIQDEVAGFDKHNNGKFAGCEELSVTIRDRLKNLKLHVFGHIHDGYGRVDANGITYINASIMDRNYRPVNKPIRVEI
jgi:Icc-related predicted phosphoesterase